MEFNEKLHELRKSRGLTQEELSEALFVSRTAISKWESGRGYPSIDSLKEISSFFLVTIDELLSGEKMISIAEKENKSNLQNVCELLIGILDIFSFLLIVLPLYPRHIGNYVSAVSLFGYSETSVFNRNVYWGIFIVLMILGVIKIVMLQLKTVKGLYKHYSSKQEILDSIVERMNQMDAKRAKEYEMPDGDMEKVIAGYKNIAFTFSTLLPKMEKGESD